MTTTEIASYQNGGYNVSLFSDGTKVREGKGVPDFPESMDIKITDQCNLHNHCKWCHEGSTPEGSHADLGKLLSVLQGLPRGVELAIGGGNPLAHPDLPEFLTSVKEMGLVPNITINELHSHQYRKQIEGIVDKVYGIGITYSGRYDLGWLHHLTDNVV